MSTVFDAEIKLPPVRISQRPQCQNIEYSSTFYPEDPGCSAGYLFPWKAFEERPGGAHFEATFPCPDGGKLLPIRLLCY